MLFDLAGILRFSVFRQAVAVICARGVPEQQR